jgi:polyvinyl alcohol dehydrogenase (cytochrome)
MRDTRSRWRTTRWKLWGVTAAIAATVVAAAPPAGAGTIPGGEVTAPWDWPSSGQNNHNTRHAATERVIGPQNVHQLAPKWTFTTAGDVSATPTVVDGTLYVPDWGGKLWAIDAATGKEIWSKSISDYNGIPGDLSRTSPAYSHGTLYIGTGALTTPEAKGAYLIAIDAKTGEKRWMTPVDEHPAAIVTGAPTVDNGIAYVGVSSKDSIMPPPQTFRGSMVAIDTRTGKMLWKTYTVPEGYTGGAVWGSQPAVSHKTGMVYVGTGQNYTVPPGVCENPKQTDCTAPVPEDHFDSILGLNLKTGKIEWSHHTLTADAWTLYEPDRGPDFDLGSGPNLYTTMINGRPTDLIGVGQKSGVYYALDPATGRVVWETQAGPGGPLGGIEWGTAVDGKHVLIGIGNGDHVPWTLKAADGTTSTTTGGGFVSLNAATGEIEWQIADPQAATGDWLDDAFVSTANGVMYAGSSIPTGTNMYALDVNSGKVLWSFAGGGSIFGGASIVNGTVYWGSGYYYANVCPDGCPGHNNKLYAFTLGGR